MIATEVTIINIRYIWYKDPPIY